MTWTLAVATYGAGLASLNAGLQLLDRWRANRVNVAVTILEAWAERDDGSDAFAPHVVVRNWGNAKAWIAVIGIQNDSGLGFDDRQAGRVRALESGESTTLEVEPGVFAPGDAVTAYAMPAPDDWRSRTCSEQFVVPEPPGRLLPTDVS
jgi:hypothetical protein